MTLWIVARQAPLSMEFSRQEYWNGLPFPPPGDLPNPGILPVIPVSPALAGMLFIISTTWEAPGWGGAVIKCLLWEEMTRLKANHYPHMNDLRIVRCEK